MRCNSHGDCTHPCAGLLPELLGHPRFVAAALATFFSAANIMFCLREREAAV